MEEVYLINRPTKDKSLRVYITEDNGKYIFNVLMGYSFCELWIKFHKISDLYGSDRNNVLEVLKNVKANWLIRLFDEIDSGKKYRLEEILKIRDENQQSR